MKKLFFIILSLGCFILGHAQEMPINYDFGNKYNDRYKYSNLVAQAEDGSGGYIMVRAYFTGLILSPKGYLIEHYNSDLELIQEYNYKLRGKRFVHGYFHNGQVYLILLDYDPDTSSYTYTAHRSPIGPFNFTEEVIMRTASTEVRHAYDQNYYNRNFSSGFTTTLMPNETNGAFLISTHFKKGKRNQHLIHVFEPGLRKILEYDLSAEAETKNYAFEHWIMSEDQKQVYIMAKAYFKKKRIGALDHRFQYELISIDPSGNRIQPFMEEDRFIEGLKPVMHKNKLVCVGFYADKRNRKFNGLAYFKLNPKSLVISNKKFSLFTEQFAIDKFGKETDQGVKNLIFKNVEFTDDDGVIFNAEEYFVTQSIQANESGGRVRVERYHHNDILCAKLNAEGELVWARNINKAEVTQGDGAYASYSSYSKDGNTYFFICTSSDEPQLLARNRLMFKQGISRNRNIFTIKLDEAGNISYEKIIDNSEARLPFMVSKPLVNRNSDELRFYAKRGNKKQLVRVEIR